MTDKNTDKKRIVYLSLVDGTQVIGEFSNISPNDIYLKNPMALDEHMTEEGGKLIYLVRYSNFVDFEKPLAFDRKMILTMDNVTELIEEYYEKSLIFAQKNTDKKFTTGISEAITYMNNLLNVAEEKTGEEHISDLHDRMMDSEFRQNMVLSSLSQPSKSRNH